MKKFIQFLVGLILVVIAAILILGIAEPKSVTITRTKLINAPKEEVFKQVVNFKNWPNWSPWYRMNPTMKQVYEGADGQPGNTFHWSGGEEKKTGEGEWKNTGIEGTQMNYEVNVEKPVEKTVTGSINTKDTLGDKTRITWTCNVEISFPFNAMLLVMDLDKALGPDFDSGLVNLKNFMEGHSSVVVELGIDIKEVDFPAHFYAGVRKTVGWDDMGTVFNETSRLLLQDQGIDINGPSTGIYYTWDEATRTTDMAAVFPVVDTATPVKGVIFIQVAAGKAYMTVCKGGISKIKRSNAALVKHLASKMQQPGVVIEEYVAGKAQQPDSNKWVTNIYCFPQ